MRTFLMVALAAALIAVLFLGSFGPVETVIWFALVIGWFFGYFKWAKPGDRRDALKAPATK